MQYYFCFVEEVLTYYDEQEQLAKPPMKNEFLANRHDAICQTAPHHRFRKTDKNPKIVSVGERKIEKMSIFENVVDNYLQKWRLKMCHFEDQFNREKYAQKEIKELFDLPKILQRKFYATLFFKHSDWLKNVSSQSKCSKK